MRRLCLKTLCAGAAAALLIAGCSDTTAPPLLQAPDGEALASTGETEIHRDLVAGPYVDRDPPLSHRLLPAYAEERNLPNVMVYRYGETGPSLYEGWAFYVDVEVNLPITGQVADPDYRGSLWTMVEKGPKNLYNVYYRFDLYDRTGEQRELIGSFHARERANCGRLPCSPRSDVEILKTTGTGVFATATAFNAVWITFQSTLKNDPGFGDMLYVWLNGTLTWNMSGGDEDDPEPKCTPAMVRKELC
jgi:hypothetical protein